MDTLNNSKCVPFVSEYSDCTDANYCSGCNRCRCLEDGEWGCERVFECPAHDDDNDDSSNQNTLTSALDVLYNGLKDREERKHRALVPPPPRPEDDLIGNNPYEEDFETYLSRQKRAVKGDPADKSDRNRTITFFHTVDEINEDTIKNSNKSGTIEANKVETSRIPKLSRRTGVLDNFNKSVLSSLHIEYNQPSDYDHHISENKIDTLSIGKNKLHENELQKLLGNYSKNIRDRDLSKLVVNELKVGNEIIGDKSVTPISNVTFTPENDTLTAMAFIAGNLLRKLWDMEKDPTDDSIEAEVLKHEKINDLLDLFKEPLSIRQETFLKNALEKLSDTLNKNRNLKNVSICETITESDFRHSNDDQLIKDEGSGLREIKTKCDNSLDPKKKKKDETENTRNLTSNVILKLNNVIGLIKKFESVEKNLEDLKHELPSKQLNTKEDIDDNLSFQLFGTLLDKITKLLISKKNKSEKITDKLRNSYLFNNKSNIANILSKKLNIIFDKIDLTTKDKLILDYLNHIESNPNCLLKSKHSNLQMKNLDENDDLKNSEGNIYDKLSKFLKVKSYIDLLKLTKLESSLINNTHSSTELPGETSTLGNILRKDTNAKLNNTKENLKSHLKAIVDDLLQLQQEHGINNTKKVNIIDALPCIYNILNSDTMSNYKTSSPKINAIQNPYLNKMKALIDTLKIEFTTSLPTRRYNYISQERPKSVKVWERLIKNINSLQRKTRRNFHPEKIKSYEELRNIMEQIESMGNTYKNFAMLSVVPPHKRLMLLKTLEADVKQQARALTNINHSLDTVDKLPLDKQKDIKEFIDNVENNILLSSKVLNHLDKSKIYNKKSEVEILSTKTNKVLNKSTLKFPKPFVLSKEMGKYRNDNVKLNRYQILNQLMMNRVQVYLKSKEEKGLNLSDDINYNIGKRILFLIQSGSLTVAKELFKIFIANKQKEETQQGLQELPPTVTVHRKKPQLLLALKEPLIRIIGPGREIKVGTGDDFSNNFKL